MSYMFFLLFILIILIAGASIGLGVSKQRYREPGEGTDFRNLNEYGEPVRTLYTSSEIFTLHHRIEITDEYGSVAYRAETQFPSIHDKYAVDIYMPRHEQKAVAILIALQHMIRDRQSSAAASGGGGGGDSQ